MNTSIPAIPNPRATLTQTENARPVCGIVLPETGLRQK
jgi:hypothetical protein